MLVAKPENPLAYLANLANRMMAEQSKLEEHRYDVFITNHCGNPANTLQPQAQIEVDTTLGVVEDTARTTEGGGDGIDEYTYEEVAKHNQKGDCWVVVNG